MAELYSDTGAVLMSSPGTIDELREWVEENVDKDFHISGCYDMDAFGNRDIVALANLAGLREAMNHDVEVVDGDGFVSKELLLDDDDLLGDMVDALNALDWGTLMSSEAYDELEAKIVEAFLDSELEEYGHLEEFRDHHRGDVEQAFWECCYEVWHVEGDWLDYDPDKLAAAMRDYLKDFATV